MKLEFNCAQCGKDRTLKIDVNGADPNSTLKGLIENAGWIVQMNYPYMDIYCSKRCAA